MAQDWGTWVNSFSGLGSQKMESFGILPLFAVMVLSLLCSVLVLLLYLRFFKDRAAGSMVHRSFPLLGPAITGIFICIQFSLPLSLGLLGALSIVRFRTPIKEPVEVGFIMVIVATALACATFNILFLGIILAVSLLGLLVLKAERSLMKERLRDGMVVVSLPRGEYRSLGNRIVTLLREKLPHGRMDSVTETTEESVISYSFVKPGPNIWEDLRSLEEISHNTKCNVFFSRPHDV